MVASGEFDYIGQYVCHRLGGGGSDKTGISIHFISQICEISPLIHLCSSYSLSIEPNFNSLVPLLL